MKATRHTLVSLLAMTTALALPCFAQEGDGMEPPPPGPGMGPREGEFGRPGRPPMEMVDRWLDQLKQRNPKEYDRLVKLREEDPEAFRMELEKRLERERARNFIDKHPQLRVALEQMPEEEREAILRRLAGGGPKGPPGLGQGPQGPGHGIAPGPEESPRSPEIEKLQGEVRELVKQYTAAGSEADKQKARDAIKGKLSALFDLREAQRSADLARFEEHVAELKEKLEKRKARKDQIIEKRLQELTGSSEELAW